MGPEHDEGAGEGRLRVPMAWLCAEYAADRLLRTGDLMEPTTLEFRAGRDALALTLFLCGGTGAPAALPPARVDELRLLTASGTPWRRWVAGRLAERELREPGDPGLVLARTAWRWLEETELLATDLEALGSGLRENAPGGDGGPQVWTPAWQLGLPLGHLAMQLY
ncbi:hypothetical protein [uncultured Streptomyces sp.]|uniref:hypothetical protein n=1 Tax=uncultured Streptomyces sp. TaxID=174707 RepID=UPI00260688DD|nr:hypothetical protein [uncultured Streptomyces sp.]